MSKRSLTLFTLAFVLSALLAGSAPFAAAKSKPPLPGKQAVAIGTGGAAATVDPDASASAIEVLRRGGNAVDAAVAAAATLGVTEPYVAGIGGGGFMVVYLATQHQVVTIDGRETAPQAFPEDAFIDPQTGKPIPFYPQRVTSGMAVGVPGTLATWAEAAKLYGTMPLARLLKPAIGIARHGFVVDQTYHDQTETNRPRLQAFTSSRALFLTVDGEAPAVGSVVRNPELAKTYEQIAREGPRAFYGGPIGAAVVQTPTIHPLRARLPARLPGPLRRDDCRRCGPLHGAAARTYPCRLPRLRRLQHGPALERRRRRSARHSTSSKGSASLVPTGRSPCTATSRRRGSPSLTATAGSAIPPTPTCRWTACSRRASRPSGAA